MAINLGNVEDIKLVELPDDMQNVQEKLDSERQKQEEFLKPFLERFYEHVKCRVLSIPVDAEIDKYIQDSKRNTIECAIEHIGFNLRDIKEAKDGADEELYVFVDDFLEQVFYLYCATELEYKKQEELKKQEAEKLQDLDDLEKAKPIFDMLKNEARKWNWGQDFDEFTISRYVTEMVELSEKHNVDLGIDKVEDIEEIPTTYATELEALEEKKENK